MSMSTWNNTDENVGMIDGNNADWVTKQTNKWIGFVLNMPKTVHRIFVITKKYNIYTVPACNEVYLLRYFTWVDFFTFYL